MGGTSWSDKHYTDRKAFRSSTGAKTFAYDDDIKVGKTAAKVHEKLDAKRVNSIGHKLRDARDTDLHPTSKGVAVLFDVTGSMAEVPVTLQKSLPKLMGLLLRKGYLEHPAILCGAIGDATCDTTPLQMGNFESGIEIENDLTNIFLEKGGGGQLTESYELAMYYMARHTAMDCFEKRGEKGYLFIIGDEMPYGEVNVNQVKNTIDDTLQAPISTKDIVAELTKMYEVYFILPHMTSNYQNPQIIKTWDDYLPQRTLHLENPEGICELIASTIGIAEGKVAISDVAADLKEFGTPKALADSVSKALRPVKGSKRTDINVPDSGVISGIATL